MSIIIISYIIVFILCREIKNEFIYAIVLSIRQISNEVEAGSYYFAITLI